MDKAIEVLKKIVFDATSDRTKSDKRLWPIRANNYRDAANVIADAQTVANNQT